MSRRISVSNEPGMFASAEKVELAPGKAGLMFTLQGRTGSELVGVDFMVPAPTLTDDLPTMLVYIGLAIAEAGRKMAEEHEEAHPDEVPPQRENIAGNLEAARLELVPETKED